MRAVIDTNVLLALALAAQVDLIITGDDDLLVLQQFNAIPIASPASALNFVND